LGNDVYEFNYSGSDTIVDTGGTDELILLVRDEDGNDPRKSFERVGDDLVITQTDGSVLTIDNQFQGSSGVDYINYYLSGNSLGKEKIGSLEVASVSESEANLLVGTSGNQTFVYEGAATLSTWTNAGNDTITTGSGDDWIRTGDGNDIIDAGQGDDYVFAGDGNDIVYMSPGADIEDGGDGIDTLILGDWAGDYSGTLNLETGANFAAGGSDNDAHKILNFENVTTQNSGDMTIYGTSVDNIITTGSGSDTVYAGVGNDTLTGNGGADTFVFIEGEAGTDTITDFDLTEGDKLDLSSYGIVTEEAAEATMSDVSESVEIAINGSTIASITGLTVADFAAADGWIA
jgi:Ca2+-binding RTX toxin-like protein